MHIKKHRWRIGYGILLFLFTGYTLLDTFVITRVYTAVPSEQSFSSEEGSGERSSRRNSSPAEGDKERPSRRNSSSGEGTEKHPSGQNSALTEGADRHSADMGPASLESDLSYKDDNISITITEYREYDTSIYAADIQVSSAEYLKTALANGAYGKNVTARTSEIAQNNGAVLAINGDYYGAREKGYVLRNGIVYRTTGSKGQEDLVIGADGSFSIIREEEVSAEDLAANGAWQILSFGPALVVNGVISVTETEEVGKAKASNPRTAIGIFEDMHYVFVVSDGRTSESEGLSLYELAQFMQTLGVSAAYNLDGGGSSAMYFNGEIINNPTTNGSSIKERKVSDIVYIGY